MKKRRLKKSARWILLGGIVLSIILIIIIGKLFANKKTIDQFHSTHFLDMTEQYQLNIHYPTVQDHKLQQRIEKFIADEKKTFFKEINDTYLPDERRYELNIQYTLQQVHHVYSIHFTLEKYIGSAHYSREDKMYYYDKRAEKEVQWNDFFNDPKAALQSLSVLAKEKLLQQQKDGTILFEEAEIQNKIEPILENFQLLSLTNEGIEILFPPYMVAPWSSGAITIFLSYEEINPLLKTNYRQKSKTSIPEKEVSNGRKVRDLSKLKNKKLVALTFDDGPSLKATTKLLDALSKRDARVSFFMMGNRVLEQKETVQRAFDAGHTIGSHTFDHKSLRNLSDIEVLKEIEQTNSNIEQITGIKPKFLRPPYGNYDEHILELSNMSFILWNLDTEDWKSRNTDTVYQTILEQAKDGSIILLHDLYDTSVEAAIKAIDTLTKEGYAFVSLEEFEQLKKDSFQLQTVYFSLPITNKR